MTDEVGVTWLPNQNYFLDRNGLQPRYVIVHGTAGGSSAVGIGNYFASTQGGAAPVASHYIIGTAGEIVQTVLEKDGAWANGFLSAGHDPWWSDSINPNNVTISVEFCKPATDNSSVLTTQQQTAGLKLITDICKRHNIPMRDADATGGITGHFSMDPVNRSNCPGVFPWTEFWTETEVTQSDYDALYQKHVALENAYDALAKEKNTVVGELATANTTIATLQPAAQKAAISSAIATLQKLI